MRHYIEQNLDFFGKNWSLTRLGNRYYFIWQEIDGSLFRIEDESASGLYDQISAKIEACSFKVKKKKRKKSSYFTLTKL